MHCQARWNISLFGLSTVLFISCGPTASAQENPDTPFLATEQRSNSEESKPSSADNPFSTPTNSQPSEQALDASDPFGGSWSDIEQSLREPVDFESLTGDMLTKELSKLRTMRIDALRLQLSVLRSQLDSQPTDRLMLLERFALAAIDLCEAELEQESSTSRKQESIRRAINALRAWEKSSLERDDASRIDATKSLSAVCLRLKWEERLVSELVKQKAKPTAVPAVQSQSISSVPTKTAVVEPSGGYYYFAPPVYRYPRTYRSR